ncbi:major facilitator superfamily domain-containing protein 6-like [Amphiura filiformis]|uniref:major facilitator superfamily domain-containing protein 6-like n=1 Tax=Amphiura filiformis TaxID=82378 RepID=UPI003B20C0CC
MGIICSFGCGCTSPTIADCDTAIERLETILHSENVNVYLDCKALAVDTPAPDTLTRHLFLQKVILPNITAKLINDCKYETNSSKVIPTLSSDLNRTKTGVNDRAQRTVMGVWDGDVLVGDDEDSDVTRRMAQDGSWLFNSISLRNAFISAFILAAFADMMQAPSISFVDVATLDSLGRGVQREGYAWQRAFGVVGYVIFSIIILCILAFSTEIITICGIDVKFTDYKVAFVIFAGVMACAVAIVCSINFKYESSGHSYHFREVLDVVLTIKYGTVLLTAFILAICNGCINTFLLWHLENLGATNIFYIFFFLSFGISEVAISFYLPIFTRSKGHACLVLMGIWLYCFIFVGYALMEKPHWVVIIEIFHGAAFALTWNPITTYLTGAVCREYLATMQGIISGAYSGLGNVIGSVCAGLMVRYNGAVVTFYGFAVICMVYGILFLVVNRETGLLHNCRKQKSRYETIGTNTNR